MIDVHVPQKSEHTWTDFFIHIATIVLGLLIAIGLEQSVEYVHHRRELAVARRQLATEYRVDLVRYRTERMDFERFVPILERNLAVLEYLRVHPGAPPSSWPNRISWGRVWITYAEGSWRSLQGSPVLALFPRKELEELAGMYDDLSGLNADEDAAHADIGRARKYLVRGQTPSEMTPAQLDDAIEATTDALVTYRSMANTQVNLHTAFPEFAPAPTADEMLRDFNTRSMELVRSERDAQDVRAEVQAMEDETKRVEAQESKE